MTAWRRLEGAGDDRADVVAEAAAALGRGEVLAHPTETVYGIGGATQRADGRVRALKGRPEDAPLLRLAHDVDALRASHPSLRWSGAATELAGAFWPGPLTLILDDGSARGLGVRVEGHPLTRSVLAAWGGTMSSTSLNPTGEDPAAKASEARAALDGLAGDGGPAVLWLDAGDLPGGRPSTLVSLRDPEPRLIREGAIDADRLAAVLGREIDRG